jgi:pimeloyl-ACP methyl ester carboxylesterase
MRTSISRWCAPLWALAATLGLTGCELVRSASAPVPTWVADVTPGSRNEGCLVVVLPGLGDRALDLSERGMLRDARAAGLPCDVALVDAHFTYYREQNLVERLHEDILAVAADRGYRTVWLVGISLGAYGAVLTARAHPELVDGVVLIAPMLGIPNRTRDVVREIQEDGGLRAWARGTEAVPRARHHFREPRLVWSWLHAVVTDEQAEHDVYLAYGDEDRFAWKHEVLAEALPPEHVVRIEGGHDWGTWSALWRELLTRVPWSEPRPVAARAMPGRERWATRD